MLGLQKMKRVGFENVVQHISAAVIIVEASSGKILTANKQAQQMTEQNLGWSMPSELGDLHDLYESGDFEILHPDGRPYQMEEWPLMRSIRDGEEVREEEFLYPLANGSRLWVRCHSSPIYGEEGRIVAGVLVAHDITEQEHAEERLRFQAHLLDAVGQAIIATDLEGRITYWNHRAQVLYGWSAEEVIDRLAREVLVSEDQEERAEVIVSELRAGRSWSGEFIVRRRDGTTLLAMVTDTPVRDEQGELKGIIGVSMDISERKESEEVLRGAHRRTEDTLESITDAFYAVDHQWRFTYINERALHYMQPFKNDSELTREELLGKDVWAVFPEAVSTVFYDIYHESMRERKVVDLE